MPDRLAAVRPHPKCVECGAFVRRLQRRRRRRGGERHRAAGDCHRWRRLDADSGRLQRRRWLEAEQWRDRAQPGARCVRQSDLCHADHAHCRRHRADDAGDGRRGCLRSLVDRRARARFHRHRRPARRPARAENPVLRLAARTPGFIGCRHGLQGEPRPARELGCRDRGILRRGLRRRADLARHQPYRLALALFEAGGGAS